MSNINDYVVDVERIFSENPNDNLVVELSDLGESAYMKLSGEFRERGYSVTGVVNVNQASKPKEEKTYSIRVSQL